MVNDKRRGTYESHAGMSTVGLSYGPGFEKERSYDPVFPGGRSHRPILRKTVGLTKAAGELMLPLHRRFLPRKLDAAPAMTARTMVEGSGTGVTANCMIAK